MPPLFEIALVLARVDYVASCIVNGNHSIKESAPSAGTRLDFKGTPVNANSCQFTAVCGGRGPLTGLGIAMVRYF
jgi:hypothetical protein